jgi:hypothetical protein
MKSISKAVTVTAGSTDAQLTTALNVQLSKGWRLVSVFTYGVKTIAILVKETAQ